MVPLSVIAERSGVSLPRVMRALLAAGIPVTPDTEVSEDLVGLLEAFEAGSALMGDDAILAFTRVLGASAMNIAEAAVALFWAEFGPGSVSEGPDELARAKLSEAATRAFLAVPDVMAQAVMDQFERSSTTGRQSVRGLVRPVGRRGGHTEGIADGPRCPKWFRLGFVDLVGSTAWAQTLSLARTEPGFGRASSPRPGRAPSLPAGASSR